MKNQFIIAILLLFSLWLVSCSNEEAVKGLDAIEISNIDIDETLTIDKDATYQVELYVKGDGLIKYVSSNPNIFKVNSSGLITGVMGGTAKLIVVGEKNDAEFIQSSRVVVVNEFVEEIRATSPAADGLNFLPSGTLNLSSAFLPLPRSASNRALEYTSSDPAVATVNPATGVITRVAKGVVQIVAKTTDGSNITSDPITVYINQSRVTVSKTGWTGTASSRQNEGTYGASRIFNGNNTDCWHVPWGGAGTPPPHWVLIDMQSVREFDKVTLYRYDTAARTVQMSISTSNVPGLTADDPSFELIGELYWGDVPHTTAETRSIDFFLEEGRKHQARYIKLYMPDTNREGNMSLAEIYLYNIE